MAHVVRGAVCTGVYLGFVVWAALVGVIDEVHGHWLRARFPDWVVTQALLLLLVGGCSAILLTFFWALRDSEHRTLHDIASRTRVVRVG